MLLYFFILISRKTPWNSDLEFTVYWSDFESKSELTWSLSAPLSQHVSNVLFSFSTFLPVRVTDAPCDANRTAVSAPIPELEPAKGKISSVYSQAWDLNYSRSIVRLPIQKPLLQLCSQASDQEAFAAVLLHSFPWGWLRFHVRQTGWRSLLLYLRLSLQERTTFSTSGLRSRSLCCSSIVRPQI